MPDIHWQVGEGKERETITQATSTRHSRRSWIAILLVVVFGVVLGIVYRSIPEPTPAWPSIPAKLLETIDRHARILAGGDVNGYLALQRETSTPEQEKMLRDWFYAWGRPADGSPLYTILDFNMRSPTQAWVTIRQSEKGHWLRLTRLYESEKGRWYPVRYTDFWSGQTKIFDTPHFHAIYAIEDRALVEPLVKQLEGVYPELVCRDLGCVEAAAEFTFTLKFGTPGVWRLSPDGGEIHFGSLGQNGVSEDNPLDDSRLLEFVTVAATQRAYYGDAKQWLTTDAPGWALFSAITDWALERRKGEHSHSYWSASDFKDKNLPPLKYLWGNGWYGYEVSAEAYFVIRFIGQEYGAQVMPKLLKALGTAQSFADVIEQGLGVPFAEFDQKWQAWAKANIPSQ